MYFARIKIGKNDEFTIGDGLLQAFRVSLDEGANASNCQFKIYDKSRKYTEKYFKFIFDNNGLTPLPDPNKTSDQTPGSVAQQNTTTSGNLDINTRAFLDMISFSEGANYNTLFGGGTFTSYADHPRRRIQGSSAAGRYQILSGTFDDGKRATGVTDFTPESQDRIAIWLIQRDNALSLVQQGSINDAIEATDETWTSFQVKPRNTLLQYWRDRVNFYTRGGQAQQQATNSTQTTKAETPTKPPTIKADIGSQITIELGYRGQILVAYSFVHTSLEIDVVSDRILIFGGQSANWVMAQKTKNTAYSNITFKQFCEKVTAQYGLKLDFQGDLNPKYEYFPQRGITDYDALIVEARRLGYRVFCFGNTLYVYDRRSKNLGKTDPEFVFEYADNMPNTFKISHTAESSNSSGGARSSDPNLRSVTGQRKATINQNTGVITLKQKESLAGKGKDSNSTTGSDVAPITPNVSQDGNSLQHQSNENLIKGVTATLDNLPFRPEYLFITPDSNLATRGISESLDRIWVIQTATHNYDSKTGFTHTVNLYSPLVSRNPPSTQNNDTQNSNPGSLPASNPNGFIKPCVGVLTSPFGPRGSGFHKGVDIAANADTPVYASQNGVVSDTNNSCPGLIASDDCGGGYGNRVFIDHSGNFQTRYAHLTRVAVSNGETVKQGQLIGFMGNSGHSRGVHLHFEIRLNGQPQNPQRYITI